MTEHFTRAEAATLAKAAGFEVRRVLGLRESVPEVVFAHGLIDEEVTALCNAAVTAIDKKREAQGAVGVVNVSDGYKGIPNIAVAWMQEVSHGAKLYTHALPAQPAEPVNAELVDACGRYEVALLTAFPNGAHGEAFTQWNEARKLLAKRAQAAPAVGVPDSCLWTPDTDYETDVHYSACGEAWSFIEGGPKENNVRFCQGCGKPVKLAASPKIGGV